MTIIKGIPDSLLAMGAVAVTIGGYSVYALLTKSGYGGPTSLTISVYPKTVKNTTDSKITVTGKFDKPASSAYYYVYEEMSDSSDPQGNARHGDPVDNGKIGDNVTSFNTPISTAGWVDGTYTLVISDQKLDTAAVMPVSAADDGEPEFDQEQDDY